MAGYWISECFPMAVTSLIPLVLFPIFGILSTADTCACYMNDTIMVFIGGLILAVAIEHSKLHLRIALGVMRTVGCTHGKLLGGLCVVTTFISMWVSNTAATAMMVPIIFAVLNELEQVRYLILFSSLFNSLLVTYHVLFRLDSVMSSRRYRLLQDQRTHRKIWNEIIWKINKTWVRRELENE